MRERHDERAEEPRGHQMMMEAAEGRREHLCELALILIHASARVEHFAILIECLLDSEPD